MPFYPRDSLHVGDSFIMFMISVPLDMCVKVERAWDTCSTRIAGLHIHKALGAHGKRIDKS